MGLLRGTVDGVCRLAGPGEGARGYSRATRRPAWPVFPGWVVRPRVGRCGLSAAQPARHAEVFAVSVEGCHGIWQSPPRTSS
eukprot:3158463-Lingulodinium_polyedra.AAC.1